MDPLQSVQEVWITRHILHPKPDRAIPDWVFKKLGAEPHFSRQDVQIKPNDEALRKFAGVVVVPVLVAKSLTGRAILGVLKEREKGEEGPVCPAYHRIADDRITAHIAHVLTRRTRIEHYTA